MPLKKTEDGKGIAFKEVDGKVLITQIDDSGKETDFNAEGFLAENPRIRKESADRRKELDKVKSDLAMKEAMFEGIDPKKAKEHAAIVEKIGPDGKLAVEKATEAMNQTWQEKFDTETAALKQQVAALNGEKITNSLLSCSKLGETIYQPADLQAIFGKFCKEDGTFVDRAGNALFSPADPGKPATIEEAAASWINSHPAGSDCILKATVKSGDSGHDSKNDQQSGDGDSGDGATVVDLVSEVWSKK